MSDKDVVMEVDGVVAEPSEKKEKVVIPDSPFADLPEGDVYVTLLVVLYLLDNKYYPAVRFSISSISILLDFSRILMKVWD